MPTVKLNRKVIENLVGKELSLEELKERISYLGTDLEHVDDKEIHVEIFPNRPDLLSEQGFSRALASFVGAKTGLREYDVKPAKEKVLVLNPAKEWKHVVACVVKGLSLDEEKVREIIQLQEKLGTTLTRNRKKGGLGLYPLDKITFPVTFTAHSPEKIKFKPLEFDKEASANDILAHHQKGQEYGKIMKGWERYPLFIDAQKNIMSMPPIINSHDVGRITGETVDVFVEGTGPDLETIKVALSILTTALSDMGGTIHALEIVYPKKPFSFPDLSPNSMPVDVSYVNKKLGLALSEEDVSVLLGKMGYGYEAGNALVPAYRADVMHPIDLIEDIAIAYGYENIPERIPEVATVAKENNFERMKKQVNEILAGLGFLECKGYHLTNNDAQNKKMNTALETIELASAVNQDYDVLAAWVIPMLMEIFHANKHHEYPQRIFTTSTVFSKDTKEETHIKEKERLACAIIGEDIDYTKIRQVFDYLMRMLDIPYEIDATDHPSFLPGRVGRVTINGEQVAYVGEINPSVLENWELEMPTAAFELDLSFLNSSES